MHPLATRERDGHRARLWTLMGGPEFHWGKFLTQERPHGLSGKALELFRPGGWLAPAGRRVCAAMCGRAPSPKLPGAHIASRRKMPAKQFDSVTLWACVVFQNRRRLSLEVRKTAL